MYILAALLGILLKNYFLIYIFVVDIFYHFFEASDTVIVDFDQVADNALTFSVAIVLLVFVVQKRVYNTIPGCMNGSNRVVDVHGIFEIE